MNVSELVLLVPRYFVASALGDPGHCKIKSTIRGVVPRDLRWWNNRPNAFGNMASNFFPRNFWGWWPPPLISYGVFGSSLWGASLFPQLILLKDVLGENSYKCLRGASLAPRPGLSVLPSSSPKPPRHPSLLVSTPSLKARYMTPAGP